MLSVTNITGEIAIFAGGCFWCMVEPFDQLEGVHEVLSGYTGGRTIEPTYEEVTRGETGHYEAVQIKYDPEEVRYEELLDIYFRNIDPTDSGGQFGDRGESYKPAIFYTTQSQREVAEAFIERINKSGQFEELVAVELLPGETFYKAEKYHQDYYKKQSDRYKKFKKDSGREAYINENWEK